MRRIRNNVESDNVAEIPNAPPIGFVNTGTYDWLISLLVSFESCHAFTAIWDKYFECIFTDAREDTLLYTIAQLFKDRKDKKTEYDIYLVKSVASRIYQQEAEENTDNHYDCLETLQKMENLLMQDLADIDHSWAREMKDDFMTLLASGTKEETVCLNKDRGLCDFPNDISETQDVWVITKRVAQNFFASSKNHNHNLSRKKPVAKYNLQKHLKPYRGEKLKGQICPKCNSRCLSSFALKKFPLVLIVHFDVMATEGIITDVKVEMPITMKVAGDTEYKFSAVIEHTGIQEDGSTHFLTKVLSGSNFYEVDDDAVKILKPCKKNVTSSNAVIAIYQKNYDKHFFVQVPDRQSNPSDSMAPETTNDGTISVHQIGTQMGGNMKQTCETCVPGTIELEQRVLLERGPLFETDNQSGSSKTCIPGAIEFEPNFEVGYVKFNADNYRKGINPSKMKIGAYRKIISKFLFIDGCHNSQSPRQRYCPL